jgi:3',5'-cyclic AMP phosphodiesterase CpdA
MGFTHKILWMSDLHQTVSGQVEGVAGGARLRQAIDQMNRYHPDATCCVASGDLTDTGEAAEYAVLEDALSRLTVPVLPMIGNHDNRANLMAALPRPGSGQDGYYQYRHDLEGGVTLLCLDTALPGSDAGTLDAARLAWLDAELSKTTDRRVLVFAHHPPGPLGLGLLDDMPLLDHQPFLDLLSAAPQVEHLFCGHVHRPVSGVIGGIPFTALRAIAHQTRPPHQDWNWSNFVTLDERPQYGVILIGPDRVVVQMIDIEDPA